MLRLRPGTTAVILIDIQERLARAMPEDQMASVHRAARILLEAARLLQVPVLQSEQYPNGLGATLPEVDELAKAARATRFEKMDFSAWDAPGFRDALGASRAEVAVVIGMEAHVCVYQTVRDLCGMGLEVHVPIDGVISRRRDHWEAGLGLCERAGAVRTTSESVVFDWLARAGTEEFRVLSKAIR
jgi:nicotinamidase-related amidase